MDFNYRIAIPTRGRSDLIPDRRGIWKYLSYRNTNTPLKIYIREEEYGNYERHLYTKDIESVPNDFKIHQKREYLIQHAIKDKVEFLFVIDDDVSFLIRDNTTAKYKLVDCTSNDDYNNHFNTILQECFYFSSEEFPCMGFAHRAFINAKKYYFEKNSPILQFVCYHIPTLQKEDIHVDDSDLIIREDQYVQLQIINKGYRTLTSVRYITQPFESNYRGGCSNYRTEKMEDKAVKLLQEMFPNMISLRYNNKGRISTLIDWKGNIPKEELTYVPKEVAIEKYGVRF